MSEVFVRKSSGMVREFSWAHLIAINSFGTILMIWPVFILASSAAAHPEANVIAPTLIAFVAVIPFLLVYWMFSCSMPRAGGDYVFLSRVLSPSIGFIMNFTLAMVVIYYTPIWVAYAMNPVLSNTLLVLGVKMANPGLIDLSYGISSPVWMIGVGILFLILFSILAIVLRPGAFGRLTFAIFIIGTLAAVVPSFLITATASQADFARAINQFATSLGAPQDYYNYVIKAADLEAMTGPYPVVTVAAIVGAFGNSYWPLQWCIFFSSYVSGEVKEAKRSQLIGMGGTVLLSLFIGLVSLFLLYGTGAKFIHSMSWLYYDNPGSYYIYPAYPGLNFISQVLTDNVFLIGITGLGYFLSFVGLPLVTFATISRCFFAWSFDRIIPTSLADIHPRFRTPYKSIIVLTLVSIGFLILVAEAPVFLPYFWMVIPNSIPWLALGIAAIIFPYKKKELFESSPVNYRLGGVPVISIAGALSLIPQLILAGVFMFDPNWAWGGAISSKSLMLTIGMMGFAAIIYFGARGYRKSKGVNMDLAFKEIPPE